MENAEEKITEKEETFVRETVWVLAIVAWVVVFIYLIGLWR